MAFVLWLLMPEIDTSGIDPELLKDPTFQRVLKDALEIQERFSAAPVYARTGKGYLKSVGVSEVEAAKRQMRLKDEPDDSKDERS